MRSLKILLFAALLAASMSGQLTTGTVTGLVTDSSGAVVPGLPINLVNVSTGVGVAVKTNGEGSYTFPLVQPGKYRLTIENAGFQKFAQDFSVQVAQTARIDVRLTLGSTTETVTVTGGAVLLESETSSLGQVVENKLVQELPLNGRNPFALLGLSAGVQPTGTQFGQGIANARAALQAAATNHFMSNGGAGGYNEILMDGIPITICCQGQATIIPSTDVVQEMKAQTNASNAEFGRTSGGVVNIITKSGGNQLHGSAYEFFRNEKLDATTFFANKAASAPIPGRDDRRGPLRYNQWGFAAGGPVYVPSAYDGRNKTFWFGGYERTYNRKVTYQLNTVPTDAMRAGDFSAAPGLIYDPLTTVQTSPGVWTRTPFAGNIIPQGRQNPIMQKYAQVWAKPTTSGISNNANYSFGQRDDDRQGNVRLDHNFSDTLRVYGRLSLLDNSYYLPDIANRFNDNAQAQYIEAKTFTLDAVKTLSSRIVLNGRYGFVQQRNIRVPGAWMDGADVLDRNALGLSSTFLGQQMAKIAPNMSIAGTSVWLVDDAWRHYSRYTHVLAANAIYMTGSHNVKAGWDGRFYFNNEIQFDGGAGTFAFSDTFTKANASAATPAGMSTYLNTASFLLGYPTSGSLTQADSVAKRVPYHGLFLQDDWRVSRTLTVNLGVRLDIEGGFSERYGRIANLDPDVATPLAGQTGLPLKGGAQFGNAQQWKTRRMLNPHVGFAWNAMPKTVVRGGFGIFTLGTQNRAYFNGNPGYTNSTTYNASFDSGNTPANSVTNPFPSGIMMPLKDSMGAMTLVGSSINGLYFNEELPYVQQWNFGIQRQLTETMLVNVAYAGSHSVHLPLTFQANQDYPSIWGAPGDTSRVAWLNEMVTNPFYGKIATGTLSGKTIPRNRLLKAYPQFVNFQSDNRGWGSSSYNSLQITLDKRLSKGLTALATYTFSKNLGNVWNTITSGFEQMGAVGYQNAYSRSIERSVLSTDVPHRFTLSSTYALPFGKGQRFASRASGAVNTLISGWQLNGVLVRQSGYPIPFSEAGQPAYSGTRPSWTGQDPLTQGDIRERMTTSSRYFNTSAFRLTRSFELGDVPRLAGSIRAMGARDLNLSLIKSFPIREGVSAQFRAEAFNALNSVVFSTPNAQFNGTSFGVISGQQNLPRNLQLALKLLW